MKSGWMVVAMSAVAVLPRVVAQTMKPVGSVAASEADVLNPGGAVVQAAAGRSSVLSSGTVTAHQGHNADVTLSRGGSVLVCQSTAVHLTAAADDALLLALDRGAFEVRMKASARDVVMTPDLRFTMAGAGPLDLRMRVTTNGDTCVENRGRKAPALNISDAFGETAYLLKPGQHVLFEHGNLRTVEDRETTPCGCPPEAKEPAGVSLADALLKGGQSTPQQQAAAAHPFPEAVSDGLAKPDPGPPLQVGERHVEVTGTLAFDPTQGAPARAGESAPVVAPAPVAAVEQPAAPEQKHGPFGAIGRFFKRIFVH